METGGFVSRDKIPSVQKIRKLPSKLTFIVDQIECCQQLQVKVHQLKSEMKNSTPVEKNSFENFFLIFASKCWRSKNSRILFLKMVQLDYRNGVSP